MGSPARGLCGGVGWLPSQNYQKWHSYTTEILYNIVKLQSQVQGLGVDFVFPLSQEQEEQEQGPPPKYIYGSIQ